MNTPNIHADLIREVLDADSKETAHAICLQLLSKGMPREQCQALYTVRCHRDNGRRIFAETQEGEWLIAIAYRDGVPYEIEGAGV